MRRWISASYEPARLSFARGCREFHDGVAGLPIRKAILIEMLQRDLSLADGMKLAKDVGFDEIECQTVSDPKEAEAIKVAGGNAGLRIHSLMNMAHWSFPPHCSRTQFAEQRSYL